MGMIVYTYNVYHHSNNRSSYTTTHYTCPRAAPTLPVPSIIPVTDDNASLSPCNVGYNNINYVQCVCAYVRMCACEQFYYCRDTVLLRMHIHMYTCTMCTILVKHYAYYGMHVRTIRMYSIRIKTIFYFMQQNFFDIHMYRPITHLH